MYFGSDGLAGIGPILDPDSNRHPQFDIAMETHFAGSRQAFLATEQQRVELPHDLRQMRCVDVIA